MCVCVSVVDADMYSLACHTAATHSMCHEHEGFSHITVYLQDYSLILFSECYIFQSRAEQCFYTRFLALLKCPEKPQCVCVCACSLLLSFILSCPSTIHLSKPLSVFIYIPLLIIPNSTFIISYCSSLSSSLHSYFTSVPSSLGCLFSYIRHSSFFPHCQQRFISVCLYHCLLPSVEPMGRLCSNEYISHISYVKAKYILLTKQHIK